MHATANACSQCECCHLLLICVVKCIIDSSSPSAAPLCVLSMSMLREWSSESSLDNLQDICGVRKVTYIEKLHRSTARELAICETSNYAPPEPPPPTTTFCVSCCCGTRFQHAPYPLLLLRLPPAQRSAALLWLNGSPFAAE